MGKWPFGDILCQVRKNVCVYDVSVLLTSVKDASLPQDVVHLRNGGDVRNERNFLVL